MNRSLLQHFSKLLRFEFQMRISESGGPTTTVLCYHWSRSVASEEISKVTERPMLLALLGDCHATIQVDSWLGCIRSQIGHKLLDVYRQVNEHERSKPG